MSENADSLLYQLSNEVDSGMASPFIAKTWLSVLDDNSTNYASSTVTISTAQLANSNKWLSFSEGYLQVPLLITVTNTQVDGFSPADDNTGAAYCIGLKNWYGSVIHSLSVSYNGTVVVQQMPFQSVLNSFKLMTSLSWQDVSSQGASMGFWPDDPLSFSYHGSGVNASEDGTGVCTNRNLASTSAAAFGAETNLNSYNAFIGNAGFKKRQTFINFDPAAGADVAYSSFMTAEICNQMYRSHVITKINSADGATNGVFQIAISSSIKLKHLSSLFQNLCLIKGAFLTLTMQMNNTSFVVQKSAYVAAAGGNPAVPIRVTLSRVNSAVGGINPLMLASMADGNGGQAFNTEPAQAQTISCSLAIGSRCLEPSQVGIAGVGVGSIGNSITLNVPSYTMNPVYEQSYLSQPIRSIPYTDFYSYTVSAVGPNAQVNHLLTNGIIGLKRLTVFPMLSASSAASTQLNAGTPVYHSPFDPALCSGYGSPLLHLGQFNVQVAGANVLVNQMRYTYEQWMQELGSCGSVNGGLTDGMSSGLLSKEGFEMCPVFTCDLSRMLPAEKTVPKSVALLGVNSSAMTVDYLCFLEFEQTGLRVDVLSGAKC